MVDLNYFILWMLALLVTRHVALLNLKLGSLVLIPTELVINNTNIGIIYLLLSSVRNSFLFVSQVTDCDTCEEQYCGKNATNI
jgi:hypothetical protein